MKLKIISFILCFIFLSSFVMAESIRMELGWNYLGIIGLNQSDVPSNQERNVTLVRGYNLIGYSAFENHSHSDIIITQSNGTRLNITQAVDRQLIRNSFQYWTNISQSSKGWSLIPQVQTYLSRNQAPFIFWNATESGNITFRYGGANNNFSYAWKDLHFTNGTNQLNITDAFTAGWIGNSNQIIDDVVQYWNNNRNRYESISVDSNLSSWSGYVIWSRIPNLCMNVNHNSTECGNSSITIVSNGTSTSVANFGYDNGFGINQENNLLYNNFNKPKIYNLTGYGYDNQRLPKLT